jgi:hypothetical protein
MSPRDFSTVKRREPIAWVNRGAGRKGIPWDYPAHAPAGVRLRRRGTRAPRWLLGTTCTVERAVARA